MDWRRERSSTMMTTKEQSTCSISRRAWAHFSTKGFGLPSGVPKRTDQEMRMKGQGTRDIQGVCEHKRPQAMKVSRLGMDVS